MAKLKILIPICFAAVLFIVYWFTMRDKPANIIEDSEIIQKEPVQISVTPELSSTPVPTMSPTPTPEPTATPTPTPIPNMISIHNGIKYINNAIIIVAADGVSIDEIKKLLPNDVVIDDSMGDIGIYRISYTESFTYEGLRDEIDRLRHRSKYIENAYMDTVIELEND